jgi:hypothetical protein
LLDLSEDARDARGARGPAVESRGLATGQGSAEADVSLTTFTEANLEQVAERLATVFEAMGWTYSDVGVPDKAYLLASLRQKQADITTRDLQSTRSGRVKMERDSWGDGSGEWLSVVVEFGDAEDDR